LNSLCFYRPIEKVFKNVPSFAKLQGLPSPRPNGDHQLSVESRDRDSNGLNGDRNGEKPTTNNLKPASNERPPSRSGSSSSRLKTKDVSSRLTIPSAQNTILYLFNYSSKNLELQVPKQDPPHQMRQQLLKMSEQYHQHQRPVVIHRHHIKDPLIHTKDHHQINTDDLQ
jgi:hypothetical protein